VEQEDGRPVPRRLVGIDLGIASRHSVRVLEADGRVVGRSSCVPTVASLAAVERAALAGAPEGTRLEVVFEPAGPAWLPVAVFFARRGHAVFRVSSAKAADLRRFLRRHAKTGRHRRRDAGPAAAGRPPRPAAAGAARPVLGRAGPAGAGVRAADPGPAASIRCGSRTWSGSCCR
jgi:hypothetical protein